MTNNMYIYVVDPLTIIICKHMLTRVDVAVRLLNRVSGATAWPGCCELTRQTRWKPIMRGSVSFCFCWHSWRLFMTRFFP